MLKKLFKCFAWLLMAASCDMTYLGDADGSGDVSAPFLVISGFPENLKTGHFSEVTVYVEMGSVASCQDTSAISLRREPGGLVTAEIPLVSARGGTFADSGVFYVSFSAVIDANTSVSIGRGDNLLLSFSEGSAFYDLVNFSGYSDVRLRNPDDSLAPVVMAGSSFYVDGFHRVERDASPEELLPEHACVLYLYAYRLKGEVFFEYSARAPEYNALKKGWYLESESRGKRALFKMFFLRYGDEAGFLFKTDVEKPWPHFKRMPVSGAEPFVGSDGSVSLQYFLDGAEDPDMAVSSLAGPGFYLVEVKGAGGGGGAGYTRDSSSEGASRGGDGGLVTEIVSIAKPVEFYAFTGSGGGKGVRASSAGYLYAPFSPEQGYQVTVITPGNDFDIVVTPDAGDREFRGYGGPGGGGGSGSFLLFAEEKVFLCAGGGGGGSGGTFASSGGAGGAGGSVGSGGAGGNAGGSAGGRGGGLFGGRGASPDGGSSFQSFNDVVFAATGGSGYYGKGGDGGRTVVVRFAYNNVLPAVDLRTNGANGRGADSASARYSSKPVVKSQVVEHTQGGSQRYENFAFTVYNFPVQPSAGADGGHGGNNIDASRGGGARGSLGEDGEPGSVKIYRFN